MKLDLLITGAEVLTMDPARPTAHTVGVWAGRVVGLDDDVAGLDAARTVDLGGATVTPGFIDAHCHTTWFGLGLAEIDVSAARTPDELYATLEAGAASLGPEDWVMATGFYQGTLGGAYPDIDRLDAVTGGRPLLMRHTSGHAAVVNSRALELAGILAPGTPDPAGGRVARDADGRATGLVEETAQTLVQDLVRPCSVEAVADALDRATRQYAREGITSFTEAGVGGGWIGHSPVELHAYQLARATGRLHARAQVMPILDRLHPLDGYLGAGPGRREPEDPSGKPRGLDLGMVSGFGDDYLSLGPVKVFLDGSLLGETAAVQEPFCSHKHTRGYFQDDPEALVAAVRAAYRGGWAIAAHAIGDRAVDLAIDTISRCQDELGPAPLPNRIEHASITRPEQLPRLAAAGIAVTPQAGFFHSQGDQLIELLGPERVRWTYRGRSFLDAGVLVAGSSDRPVADGDVLRAMQAWLDRRTASGAVLGSPAEALTAREALEVYTSAAAAACGLAGSRGSLAPGKLADLVVLSESPLEVAAAGRPLTEIEVLATVVGGRETHGDLAAARPRAGVAP